jgi:hypothetical protein
MSEKFAVEDLKPVVLEFAMLLDTTSSAVCAASIPLSAVPKDMNFSYLGPDLDE